MWCWFFHLLPVNQNLNIYQRFSFNKNIRWSVPQSNPWFSNLSRGCKGHCIDSITVKVKQGKDSITYTFVGVVTSGLNFVFYVVAGCQATCTGWWFVPDFFNKLINSCSNSRWTYNLHIYMCMFTCHAAHLQLNLLTNDPIFLLQLT